MFHTACRQKSFPILIYTAAESIILQSRKQCIRLTGVHSSHEMTPMANYGNFASTDIPVRNYLVFGNLHTEFNRHHPCRIQKQSFTDKLRIRQVQVIHDLDELCFRLGQPSVQFLLFTDRRHCLA